MKLSSKFWSSIQGQDQKLTSVGNIYISYTIQEGQTFTFTSDNLKKETIAASL